MSRLANKLIESLPSPGHTTEDAEDRKKNPSPSGLNLRVPRVLCGSCLEMALESASSCVARP
jgi:hypothetical protein